MSRRKRKSLSHSHSQHRSIVDAIDEDEQMVEAARRGSLVTLRQLWRRYHQRWIPTLVVDMAARKGHLDILKWAHENRVTLSNTTIIEAAATNQLECLRYCHQHVPVSSWDIRSTMTAAHHGHINVLQFMYECLKTVDPPRRDALWNHNLVHAAISNGQLECLKWLHTQGNVEIHHSDVSLAIIDNQIKCLLYVLEAIKYELDDTDCLKYLLMCVTKHQFDMLGVLVGLLDDESLPMFAQDVVSAINHLPDAFRNWMTFPNKLEDIMKQYDDDVSVRDAMLRLDKLAKITQPILVAYINEQRERLQVYQAYARIECAVLPTDVLVCVLFRYL